MSKLNFKDPAESALVNAAFLGRSVDDTTTGKLTLANTDTPSGDTITNLQAQVNANKSKLMANQTVSGGGNLLYDEISTTQIKRIESTGGAVTASATPFGATPTLVDGTIIYLIGQSDTNTVTFTYNDAADGCLLNGDATIKLGYCLQLFYDDGLSRFIEIGRNF